jgi:hypothetical protein
VFCLFYISEISLTDEKLEFKFDGTEEKNVPGEIYEKIKRCWKLSQ